MSDADNHASAEAPFRPGGLGRVVRVPEGAPPPMLHLRPGEELTAVGYDQRWPGYVLCGNLGGQSGWVPESVLLYVGPGMAIARGDYSAAVLRANAGDALALHAEANGWYWASRADGQAGWVLAEHVKVLDED
jgi:hypothetical protein